MLVKTAGTEFTTVDGIQKADHDIPEMLQPRKQVVLHMKDYAATGFTKSFLSETQSGKLPLWSLRGAEDLSLRKTMHKFLLLTASYQCLAS